MPIYEYVCTVCGTRFDRLQPMGTDNASCLKCGQPAQKVLSIFAAVTTSEDGEMTSVAGAGGCPSCAGGVCGCSMA